MIHDANSVLENDAEGSVIRVGIARRSEGMTFYQRRLREWEKVRGLIGRGRLIHGDIIV